MNDDRCSAGREIDRLETELSVDSLGLVCFAREIAEGIASQHADEADFPAEPGGGDGLIRSLAARPEAELRSHDRLPPRGKLLGAEREIRNEAPHHGDPFPRHAFLRSDG